MKRILVLISLMLAIVLALALTACRGDAGEEQGTNGPDGTGDVQTEETDDTEESSGTETVTLNTDFLNEYKMTFGELTAKHGKVVGYHSNVFYKFENGYGYYLFYSDYDRNKLVTDPDTGVTYLPVEDDELCRGTWYTSVEALFNGPFESMTIEEFSKLDGIIAKEPVETERIPQEIYHYTSFLYAPWGNDKVEICIQHKNENIIDLDSEVRIYIHPQYIEAEENQ